LYLFASSSDNLDCDGFCFITFVKVDLGILSLKYGNMLGKLGF
jgi:hypothetical protein